MATNKLILLSILSIFLSILSLFLNNNRNDLTWSAVQTNGDINVYLKGASVEKVAGLDLKVLFDKNVQVSSVEAGGFFVNPIIIKFDDNNFSYSLMSNPENKVANDLSKPVVIIHLTQNYLVGTKFYVLPTSLLYLYNVGGVYPKESHITLK